MDDLETTHWDVLIAGTGLSQSLLALALSRSGKKVLHVDKNDFYGGAEAAFSLQEAEQWAGFLSDLGNTSKSIFSNVAVKRHPNTDAAGNNQTKLSFSRAYNLALSPQLIYAGSLFIPALVSSKIYRQLEFLAVGTWWVYNKASGIDTGTDSVGTLTKVPSSREEIFTDTSLQSRAKRALMKCLKFIANYEEQSEVWEPYRAQPFSTFLTETFSVPLSLQEPLHALTLTGESSGSTTTEYALSRLARHLRSIGVFGPGFSTIIPKWGGLSEIPQIACRAGAVGGFTYVLGNGVAAQEQPTGPKLNPDTCDQEHTAAPNRSEWILKGGEKVSTTWLVGLDEDIPATAGSESSDQNSSQPRALRSISIVSSPLSSLLPSLGEGAPPAAGAVIVFPQLSLSNSQQAPVNILLHSSETGECPSGQSILYASIADRGEVKDDTHTKNILEEAVARLLSCVSEAPKPMILWSMSYKVSVNGQSLVNPHSCTTSGNGVVMMSPLSLDLALDDAVLDQVKEVWRKIMGDEADDFLVFEDREGADADDE